MDKNLEKLEEDQERDGVCESDQAQEDLRSSAQVLECPRRGSNAPVFACKRRTSITRRSIAGTLRSSAPVCEAQTSRSPILEIFGFRVGESLLHKDSNPTIFRVSRILLESINRPENTEKHTRFWRRIDGSQGSDFSGLFFSFILFYEDD